MAKTEIDWTLYDEFFINKAKKVEEEQNINFLDEEGNSILMYAALFGYIDIVKLILEEDVDINIGKITPLIGCLGRKSICNIVLNYSGLNIELLQDEQVYIDILNILIKSDCDVNKSSSGLHPLVWSSLSGNEKELELLLKNGSNVNFQDNNGISILMWFIQLTCSERNKRPYNEFYGDNLESIVELLIKYNANINIQNNDGETAYRYAINTDKYGIIKLLIDNEADIVLKQYSDESQEVLDKKLEQAKENQKKNRTRLVLENVLKNRNVEQLKLLVNSGINLSNVNILELILKEYSNDFLEVLLKSGVNVNIEKDNYTPLLVACMNPNRDMDLIKLLLKYGANINILDENGDSPLGFVTAAENIELVKLFLQDKRKNKLDKKIISKAFSLATAKDNLEMIKLFLDYLVHEKNNPQNLVKILTNFTSPNFKPIRYTTHSWDFGGLEKEYGSFNEFMKEIKLQWDDIKGKLKELSPNLYEKVYNFLWETDDKKALGWSSTKGLDKWCDTGKLPCEYKVGDQTFGEIIYTFKNEIEIRKEHDKLEDIFIQERKKLGRRFKVELVKLKGKTFYTDVEKFKNVLSKIFDGIIIHAKDKDDNILYPNIKVEALDDKNGNYVELYIRHIYSFTSSSATDMLKEIDDGDFADIKSSLTNLCDWSIQNSYNDENYQVNYLRSTNKREIEELSEKPIGFTQILRFYNK